MVIDIKTARDPSPEGWGKAVKFLGYRNQAALYLDGIRRWLGLDPTKPDPSFLHLVVPSEEPFEDVGLYELSQGHIDIAREENRRTLGELKVCRETGDWRSPWSKGIQELCPSDWELRNAGIREYRE